MFTKVFDEDLLLRSLNIYIILTKMDNNASKENVMCNSLI